MVAHHPPYSSPTAALYRHLAAGHGAIMLLDKMMAQFELLTGLKPDAQHMGQTLGPCLEEVAGKVEPMTRQDLALGFPVGGNDGMANYAKLKEHWLMGSRNRSHQQTLHHATSHHTSLHRMTSQTTLPESRHPCLDMK